ncbi:MAG: YgiT-type zinc finger protein [Candidatus Vecturithrix sp.]|jgi:YgiT-type zinc finger domain-containing protein|nr:YgiT-type zinc finger protein [Candidatus Vecturithrix sp.]
MYGYTCEYCQGTVQEKIVEREAFKHKRGFVILEHVPIGVCDTCGARYYHAELLHQVEDIASQKKPAERMESVPVATVA